MSLVAHSVSFSCHSDEITPPFSSSYNHASSSSPSKRVSVTAGKVSLLAGPSRLEPLIPLAPAKTVALTRRAVNFSPRTDTKYFHSDHSIIPSPSEPPPSIRSYRDSDKVACSSSSPLVSPSLRPHRSSSETPSNVRSILKSRVAEIRVAASVEEGTLNNKEPARLVVTGKRPRIVARDSFQLAMLRKAASDGVGERDLPEDTMGKGKGKMTEDAPGSDDSVESEESRMGDDQRSNASSEEEEEVEETGELSLESLVRVILDPPEELLSLEEAYNNLSTRLRIRFSATLLDPRLSPASKESIRLATQPLRDEAPAMVRAMQRDILRLLGKLQYSDTSDVSSTPFCDLKPLRDSPPEPSRSRFTPSPSVTPTGRSPTKAARQGYTEAEVRFRREASGVGGAALKFLAFVFASPHLWECFTEADLIALIDKVLLILRTPRLPTPNQKRTYHAAITLLAQIRLPGPCIAPVKEKIAGSIEMIFNDGFGSPAGGTGANRDMGQIKKEAYHAIINLVNTYPSLFFAEYATLLPHCLRGMASPAAVLRSKASAAAAAFVAAKLNMLYARTSSEEWAKNRTTVQRCEAFVVSHLKSLARTPGRAATVYNSTGEKRTEWLELQRVFKETVGAANGVAWACATWSVVMSLMGQAYETSTIASGPNGMNHIMERSLSMTTNGVRPLFASVAWCHAIHSYLLTNSASSLNENNELIQSFSPWSSTPANDWQSRLETVLMPVEFALQKATEPRSFSTEYSKGQWQWRRPEEPKQTRWMITTAQMASSIVYAFSGTALYHVDQPAKEMTAITGLPSSDGASVFGDVGEEAKLERLDKVWERVVRPLVKRLTSVCGVDELKLHGWAILEAIVRPEEPGATRTWSLDRLCSTRYLSGEVFATEKEMPIPELKAKLEADIIQPSEIPPWSSTWIASRLDKVLDLFQDVISNMAGISRPIAEWEGNARDPQVVPSSLSRIWNGIIQALARSRHDDTSDASNQGLVLALRHILQIFNRDPASHVPLARLNEDAKTIHHADTFRLDLFSHLLNSAIDVLGDEAVSAIHLDASQGTTVDQFIASQAFGTNADGHATMAGGILGQILRSSHPVLSLPLEDAARQALASVVGRLVALGSKGDLGTKMLGDMTNALPFMFEPQEELRLDMWRIIAVQWTQVMDLQPSASASSTNHTAELLVSLLSCPFRAVSVESAWHQGASIDDLRIWQELLKTVVMRFKAKKVGSNLGVLENLAGHLRDFLEGGEKTSSSTITLSCLASAISWLTFVPTEARHATHYSINENYVPVDFLAIVSNALLDSYPSPDSQPSPSGEYVVSPGVATLLKTFGDKLSAVPAEFVTPVLDACRPGIVTWLTDDYRIASVDLNATLDGLYISLLGAISTAIRASAIPSSSATLQRLLDIYAPRLSRAQTSAVPKAFQALWEAISPIPARDLSDDVRGFAEQILAAVPGMITVPGLIATASVSEEESLSKYPHALEVERTSLQLAQPVRTDVDVDMKSEGHDVLIDATEMEIDPTMLVSEPTAAYDADESQLKTQRPRDPPSSSTRTRSQTKQTIIPGTSSSKDRPSRSSQQPPQQVPSVPEQVEPSSSMEVGIGGDVFGPTGQPAPVPTRTRRRRRARNAKSVSRSHTATSIAPAVTVETTPNKLPEVEVAEAPLVPSLASQIPVDEDTNMPSSHDVDTFPAHALVDGTVDQIIDDPVEEIEEPAEERPSLTQAPLDDSPNALQSRPSLLSSAKGWLARVPSFSLFSPTSTRIVEGLDLPAVGHNLFEDVAPASGDVTQPTGSSTDNTKGKGKALQEESVESVTLPAVNSPMSTPRKRKSDVIDLTADDDEDELLLSPESARKRRREEEEAIRQSESKRRSRGKRTKGDKSSPPSIARSRSSRTSASSVSIKSEQGATPKASASDSPSAVIPPSPAQRSTQQERLLSMLDEAAAAKRIVDNLDFDGILALMRNVDALRVAAQENLERRAEEARARRRRRQ